MSQATMPVYPMFLLMLMGGFIIPEPTLGALGRGSVPVSRSNRVFPGRRSAGTLRLRLVIKPGIHCRGMSRVLRLPSTGCPGMLLRVREMSQDVSLARKMSRDSPLARDLSRDASPVPGVPHAAWNTTPALGSMLLSATISSLNKLRCRHGRMTSGEIVSERRQDVNMLGAVS